MQQYITSGRLCTMIKIAILEDEKAAAKKLTTFFDR